jgi:hypothetical protein
MELPLAWFSRGEEGQGSEQPTESKPESRPVLKQGQEEQEWPRQAGLAQPVEVPWAIEVPRGDRWAVWQRLQELGIPCTCRADRPLLATVDSPLAVWQVWHVLRMQGAPAPLRDWLERCYEAVL